MSMQLSNSKLRQAQLKPDRATCSLYLSPCLTLSTPSHSSVEQQPGLALAQSPLLSCFPASLRLGQDTHCVMQSHQMRSRRSPLAHSHTHTHTVRVCRADWHMERDTGKQQEVRRKLANAKNAKSTRLLSLEMPKSQTHTHTDTHARTRRRLRMKLC